MPRALNLKSNLQYFTPMGSSSSSMMQSFQYYSKSQDPNMGLVQVYTCRSLPQTYIMRILHHQYDQALIDIFEAIEDQQSKHLITMFGCKESAVCQCNSLSGDSMLSFWEYNIFYLDQLIQKRVIKNVRFSDEEVWHIIGVCLEGYSVLRSKNVYYDFSPQKVVIAPPEGKAKLFWSHLKVRNAHLAYFEHFQKESETILSYFSPEQLTQMRNNHRNTSLNLQKCNMFSLGLLIFYVMSLTDPLLFYNSAQYTVDLNSLQTHIFNKVQPYYSRTLLNFLEACIHPEPSKRKSSLQLYHAYSKYFQTSSHLNMIPSSNSITQKTTNDANLKRISLKRSRRN